MPRHRLPLAGAAIAASLLVASACGSSGGKDTPSTQPLTGLPVSSTGTELHRPAIMVKIENAPQARPQSGLDLADVVYEAVAEGGITRFAALFQSVDPGLVGPVRSVRPQDPDIAGPLDGLAAFSGGLSAFVDPLNQVAQNVSSDVLGEGPPYERVTTRQAPHNLYVNGGGLWPKANSDHQDPPKPLFEYGDIASSATAATAVTVSMSPSAVVKWTWDGSYWRRSQNGEAFTVTGQGRIGAADVLVQTVKIDTTQFVDPAGTPVPASILIGTGQAMLFRDGKVIRGTWSKSDQTSPTAFTTADGKTMLLHPGRTWVELAPTSSTVSVTP
jgi:hypothetical protein